MQRTASSAAGHGTTMRGTCARPVGTTTTRRTAMTMSAFAVPQLAGGSETWHLNRLQLRPAAPRVTENATAAGVLLGEIVSRTLAGRFS